MARVSPVPTFISASGQWVLWGDSWRGGGEDKGPHEPPGSLAGGVAGPAVLGSLRRNRNALLTGDNRRLHTTVWVSGSGWGGRLVRWEHRASARQSPAGGAPPVFSVRPPPGEPAAGLTAGGGLSLASSCGHSQGLAEAVPQVPAGLGSLGSVFQRVGVVPVSQGPWRGFGSDSSEDRGGLWPRGVSLPCVLLLLWLQRPGFAVGFGGCAGQGEKCTGLRHGDDTVFRGERVDRTSPEAQAGGWS